MSKRDFTHCWKKYALLWTLQKAIDKSYSNKKYLSFDPAIPLLESIPEK